MPTASDPAETVRRLFAPFAARDLDALAATVHPDSRWVYFGANPRLTRAEFNGRDAVRSFFEKILARSDISSFDPKEYVVQGNTVIVIGNESGVVKKTGVAFQNEWAQKYVVEDGLVVEMAEWNVQVSPREGR